MREQNLRTRLGIGMGIVCDATELRVTYEVIHSPDDGYGL